MYKAGTRIILLGDNTGGGAVMLRPVRFQRVGVWILVDLPCIVVIIIIIIIIIIISPQSVL
jgi:hypothetical protein